MGKLKTAAEREEIRKEFQQLIARIRDRQVPDVLIDGTLSHQQMRELADALRGNPSIRAIQIDGIGLGCSHGGVNGEWFLFEGGRLGLGEKTTRGRKEPLRELDADRARIIAPVLGTLPNLIYVSSYNVPDDPGIRAAFDKTFRENAPRLKNLVATSYTGFGTLVPEELCRLEDHNTAKAEDLIRKLLLGNLQESEWQEVRERLPGMRVIANEDRMQLEIAVERYCLACTGPLRSWHRRLAERDGAASLSRSA